MSNDEIWIWIWNINININFSSEKWPIRILLEQKLELYNFPMNFPIGHYGGIPMHRLNIGNCSMNTVFV